MRTCILQSLTEARYFDVLAHDLVSGNTLINISFVAFTMYAKTIFEGIVINSEF